MLNSVILAQPAMQQAFAGIAPGGIAVRGGTALGGIAPGKIAPRAAGPGSGRSDSESFGFRLAEQTRPDASLLSREPVRYLAARDDRGLRRAFSFSSAESSTARRAAEPRDRAAGVAKAGGSQAAGGQTQRAQTAAAQTREAQIREARTREAKTRGDRANRREASPRDEEREPRTGGVDRAAASGSDAVDADRRPLPRNPLADGSIPVSGQDLLASRPPATAAEPRSARQGAGAEGDQEYAGASGETAEARADDGPAAIVGLGLHFGGIPSDDASGAGTEFPGEGSGLEAAYGEQVTSTDEGGGEPGRSDPAAWEGGGEGSKNRILPFVPRETINQTLNPYMSPVVQPDGGNVLPNTHATVETAVDALGSAGEHVSRSFYAEKTNPLDLGANAGTGDSQKFPQGATAAGAGGEGLAWAGREVLGPMEQVGDDGVQPGAASTAEPGTPAAGFDPPGVLDVESLAGTAEDGDPVRQAGRSSGRASREPASSERASTDRALGGQDASVQHADSAESASPAADADRQVPAAWQAAAASAASDPTAMLLGRWSNVPGHAVGQAEGQATGHATGTGGPGGLPDNAAPNSDSAPADGRRRGLGGEPGVPPEAGRGLPVAELERAALQLQIATVNSGQTGSQDEEDPPNQTYRSISSTLASARLYGKIPANPAVGSGAGADGAGGKQAEAAKSLAAIADSAYRSQLRPAGDVFRLPGAENGFEPLRPPAGSDGGTAMQSTVLSPHASRPLSALNPGASAGSSTSAAAAGSEASLGASEAETVAESASRFVRAAALANASGGQRLQVLLQDDQLGRISLRMVDRAGLIQAVVRTDGARAAQLISESLPVLLESLAQRGLPASWTSSQGQSQEQPADPRQGQPRRQRQPGGQGSGPGGRRLPGSEAVFRVEVR